MTNFIVDLNSPSFLKAQPKKGMINMCLKFLLLCLGQGGLRASTAVRLHVRQQPDPPRPLLLAGGCTEAILPPPLDS